MKLDINEVYHQYVIRIVIFSLFLYKRQYRRPTAYIQLVLAYVTRRLPWNIKLKIDAGLRLNKDEERDIILEEVLNNVESDYLTTVIVTFTTPLKEMTLEIDLKDEEKYEKFIYS